MHTLAKIVVLAATGIAAMNVGSIGAQALGPAGAIIVGGSTFIMVYQLGLTLIRSLQNRAPDRGQREAAATKPKHPAE